MENSIEYKIKVMEAFKEGREIEYKKIEYKEPEENKWKTGNPTWSWGIFDYRIKSETNYRPFKWEERLQLMDKWIKRTNSRVENMHKISAIYKNNGYFLISFCDYDDEVESISFDDLLDDFVFIDSEGNETPCGVLEE